MRIQASFAAPPSFEPDYERRNHGPDEGLINAWLAGVSKRSAWPHIAQQAAAGELPPLPYKGGIPKQLKTVKEKIGSMHYLAMWTGLRGEDLDLDTEREETRTCTKYGVKVLFTLSTAALFANNDEPEGEAQ